MLGRACFSEAPAPSVRQAGKASAAPIAFKKDRLDTRVRSIDIVPCIALPLTHGARLTAQVFYLPAAGPLHNTETRPCGKQAMEDSTGDARTQHTRRTRRACQAPVRPPGSLPTPLNHRHLTSIREKLNRSLLLTFFAFSTLPRKPSGWFRLPLVFSLDGCRHRSYGYSRSPRLPGGFHRVFG
jgi:hypothetical protein